MTSSFYDDSKNTPIHPNEFTLIFLDDDLIIFDDVNP